MQTQKYGVCTGAAAGAIFARGEGENREILLLNRATEPYGWACPATHIIVPPGDIDLEKGPRDHGRSVLLVEFQLANALMRKIGLTSWTYKRAVELTLTNPCRRTSGCPPHQWFIFFARCADTDLTLNPIEVANARWVKENRISDLELEPAWRYIFDELDWVLTTSQ